MKIRHDGQIYTIPIYKAKEFFELKKNMDTGEYNGCFIRIDGLDENGKQCALYIREMDIYEL